MPLLRNISEEEWAVLAIVTDPILFGEYLRNTADGSPTHAEWPKRQFKYRWYQKDLLSDQSEWIALVAGRAVGKCSPGTARIYTYPYGYLTINELRNELKAFAGGESILVYTQDPNNTKKLVQRRATIHDNGIKPCLRLTTEGSGHVFDCTGNHPILTPRGWINAEDLEIGDQVAVLTQLPSETEQHALSWEELRYFGYVAGSRHIRPEMDISVKFQRQVAELRAISEFFDTRMVRNEDGSYKLLRRKGPLKHFVQQLINDLGLSSVRHVGFRKLPFILKAENKQNIVYFLEAYFSAYAEFSATQIKVQHHTTRFLYDIQELLLRFGIESKVTRLMSEEQESEELSSSYEYKPRAELTITQYKDYYTFFHTLDIPGVQIKNLKLPPHIDTPYPYAKFEKLADIESLGLKRTYAISVPSTENYLSNNLIVHNSLVLEDKQIFQAVNVADEFPITKEALIATANLSQLTPILDRIILRFTNSPLLKDFLKNNINRSKGTLDFPIGSENYRLNARIAGQRGDTNMVGLHLPKVMIDEVQLFTIPAFTQLEPAINTWEPKVQVFVAGVPSGQREGNLLYLIDQRAAKWKRYRIPAHQNPYFTYAQNIDAIKRYGGEDSDDYQTLILGRHGEAAFSIIPRDKIVMQPFAFYSYRYTQTDKHNGRSYKDIFDRPIIDEKYTKSTVLAVDTGYADPTVAQVLGQDSHGVWRTLVRYRLTRISFPEQAEILDWLDDAYHFDSIAVDLGAGGGGIGLTQDLQSGRFAKSKDYIGRITGVRFSDYLTEESAQGDVLKTSAKSFAGQELARLISEKELVFSELDAEGISQVERVAYQRLGNGLNQYFVISERGAGKSNDDHIFASYIVFVLMLLTLNSTKRAKPALLGPTWI